jgi:hypothetical protein
MYSIARSGKWTALEKREGGRWKGRRARKSGHVLYAGDNAYECEETREE